MPLTPGAVKGLLRVKSSRNEIQSWILWVKSCHEGQYKDKDRAGHQKRDSFFGRMFFRVSKSIICLKSEIFPLKNFIFLLAGCFLMLFNFKLFSTWSYSSSFLKILLIEKKISLSHPQSVFIAVCLGQRWGLWGVVRGRVVLAQTALSGGGSRCWSRGRYLSTFRVTHPWVQGMHLCVTSSICLDSSFWHVTLSFSLTCRSTG